MIAREQVQRGFGQKNVEGFLLLHLPKMQKELGMTRAQFLRIIAREQAAEALIETASPPPTQNFYETPIVTAEAYEFAAPEAKEVVGRFERQRPVKI